MGKLIHLNHLLGLKGRCKATTRCAFSHRVIQEVTYENTLFSGWLSALASDIANTTAHARPVVLAFSKSIVPVSPQPTALTAEFRAAAQVFSAGTSIQIISVLGATEGNSPSGNIKSMGFYYGSDATTTLLTGTLGSLINTMDVAKDSSVEVTFQYDIELG